MIDQRALREAVVNAIVHNDYSNGSSPKFEFFSDRLEITSAGSLPHGVELADFLGGHSSPRNKEIMRVFRDLEIVEHLGSGVPRILEKYDPSIFQISTNFLRVVFHYAKSFEDASTADIKVHDEVHDEVHEGVHDEVHDLTDTEQSILSACLNSPQSTSDLLQNLGYTARTGHFRKALTKLCDSLGLLELTLPDTPKSKNQKYRLTAKGREIVVQLDKGQ